MEGYTLRGAADEYAERFEELRRALVGGQYLPADRVGPTALGGGVTS